MKVLVFELRGSIAHFRYPDTTVTHVTYPFITRTAVRGLLGAILGLECFAPEEGLTGIRLMSPVRKSVQGISMLGKGFLGEGNEFSRWTSTELLVSPHYRIFYAGPFLDELAQAIKARQSVYHTYLGVAFAQTFPEWKGVRQGVSYQADAADIITTLSVVPTHVVGQLVMQHRSQVARVGGMLYEYLGDRRFRGTINLLYDTNCGPITFMPSVAPFSPRVELVDVAEEGIACLW